MSVNGLVVLEMTYIPPHPPLLASLSQSYGSALACKPVQHFSVFQVYFENLAEKYSIGLNFTRILAVIISLFINKYWLINFPLEILHKLLI